MVGYAHASPVILAELNFVQSGHVHDIVALCKASILSQSPSIDPNLVYPKRYFEV